MVKCTFFSTVRSAVEPNFVQMQQRQTMMSTHQQQVQIETPIRVRKTSTDSTETNVTSFKSLSSDGSNGSKHHPPQNLKGDAGGSGCAVAAERNAGGLEGHGIEGV